MNRRTKSRRPQPQKTAYKRNTKKSTNPFNGIKKNVNLVVIWVLVVVNAVLISSFVHKIITPGQAPQVATDFPIADPIKVQVLNGCGVSGIANEFAELLQRKQYDVVDISNATNWDYEKTVIINRERQDRKNIEKFRELVGVPKELVYLIKNDEVESDITLILGMDYESLKAYKLLQ